MAALRKEAGLTQAQLAKKLDISQTMVAYYENQSPSPSVDVAQKCAEALGVPLTVLVDEGRSIKRVKPGPKSQLEERMEKLRKLPRKQQELVLRMLDAALESVAKK